MSVYNALFTPWKVNKLDISNRIVQCSMNCASLLHSRSFSHIDKEAAAFFLQRGHDGVGLVIANGQTIVDSSGKHWLHENSSLLPELTSFMEEFHSTGSKLFLSLMPGYGRCYPIPAKSDLPIIQNTLGKITSTLVDTDYLSASASELPNRWNSEVNSRELSKSEISQIVEAFGKTALLLKQAGVDGIEINGLHDGLLPDQFALSAMNHRKDEYGGSLENRLRFTTDLLKAVKETCGSDYPVSLRYSVVSKMKAFCEGALPGEAYTEYGRDLSESKLIAQQLEKAGFDLLNCDNGCSDSLYWYLPPQYMPKNCNLAEVKQLRSVVSIPVVCSGKMDLYDAAEEICSGQLDAVGIARQNLVDTDWVTKLKEERVLDIKPCIGCQNGCMIPAKVTTSMLTLSADEAIKHTGCALNPAALQAKHYHIEAAKEPKRVAVLGGGIAGMEAALVLQHRGHVPVIFEKSNSLGGTYNAAASLFYNDSGKQLLEWYTREIRRSSINVFYATEVNDIGALSDFDAVIVATGAVPRMLPIPGFQKTVPVSQFLADHSFADCDRVVLLGGGFSGCETAIDLIHRGKHPIIVDSSSQLITEKNASLSNTTYLRDYLKYANVPVYLNAAISSIQDSCITIRLNKTETIDIDCDLIVNTSGFIPFPIGNEGTSVYRVGNCKQVGNLRSAIWSAWDAAMKI